MRSCDALGGAVVGREQEFEVTSLRGFLTSLRGFLTSPRIPVYVQLLHPQVHHRTTSSIILKFIIFNLSTKNTNVL